MSTTADQPEPKHLSQDKQSETSITRFVDFWWIQIPGKLRAYSKTLWAVWSDGVYLTAWPRMAAILVFAVFAFGFFEGGTHWSMLSLNGYGLASGFHSASFAQMLPLMALAVLLGSLSANLGLMLVIGFALGDFFWSGVPFSPWERNLALPPTLYGRIPQLAAYLVFFFLAAWPITANKFLVAAAHRRFRESELRKTVLMVVVQALFIYEWTYFAAMGVKQQWDCCMQTSPLDVRYFHQTTLPWLVAAAVVGVVARRVLINVAEKSDPNVISRLDAVCDPAWASISRMPGWLHAIIGAIIMTLLFLGFAVSLPRVIMTFAAVLALMLLRTSVLSGTSLWRRWSTRLARYPAVIRLGLATVATYLVSRLVLTVPGWGAIERTARGNFAPELVSVLIGLWVVLVLLPNGTLAPEEEELATDSRPSRVPIPSPVIQAGILISLVLLASKRALATPCEAGHCCYGGNNGLAGSSAAGSTTSAAGTAADSGQPQYKPGFKHVFRIPGYTSKLYGNPSEDSPVVGTVNSPRVVVDGRATDSQGNTWYRVSPRLNQPGGWLRGADTTDTPTYEPPPPAPQGPTPSGDPIQAPPPPPPHRDSPGLRTGTVMTSAARG